jgi:hypothetical protein
MPDSNPSNGEILTRVLKKLRSVDPMQSASPKRPTDRWWPTVSQSSTAPLERAQTPRAAVRNDQLARSRIVRSLKEWSEHLDQR